MSDTIFVVKRNGQKVPLNIEKIQKQVARACDGIPHVSPSTIELSAQIQFHDGITTEIIDQLLLRSMVNLIDVQENPHTGNTNYQYAAGRQRLAMLRKHVYGTYEPPHIIEIIKKNISVGLYTPDLLKWYTEDEWNYLNGLIQHDKDEKLSFSALEQFIDKYLVQNRSTKNIYETPQIRYMIAAATAFHMEEKDRLTYVHDYYEAASDGLFTLATPVLAGLGTNKKQFSSCVLLSTDDTKKSIFATGEMIAEYAAARAGIGLEIGRIRPLGAPVNNGAIAHTGIVPFLKKWFYDLRSVSQGGIRNASATVTMPIWHYQFDDFIVLKNNQGTDENRVRHMDYNVVMSAFFFRRFKQGGDVTFFDPNEVPELYDIFFKDIKGFEEMYVAYEKRTDLKTKSVPAETVIKDWILKERMDTGRIYLTFIDNVINHTPFDVKTDPIVQSNLCQEILLPTVPFQRLDDEKGRIALCTLGSMNWGAFRHPKEMNYPIFLLVRALSNILGYQDFLSIQSKLSNEEFEPVGVGMTNLAYWHAKKNLKYGQPDALAEVKRWMEHQAYYLTHASVELAIERGPCKKGHTTCYAKGIFPWEKRSKHVDELTDFTPTLPWEELRERMVKAGGTRNATLMAQPPVESSSVVIDSTNGIEMPMALISIKESKGSALIQVVPEYNRLKNKYQLMWDQTDCIDYIKTAAVMAAYTDQSISTNTFYSPKHFPEGKIDSTKVATNVMLALKWGLCTLYYNLMEKTGARADLEQDASVSVLTSSIDQEDEEDCLACKL